MSDPADVNGWAPPDSGATPQAPGPDPASGEAAHGAAQPYGPPQPHDQQPYGQQTHGQPPYPGPYPGQPYGQAPYPGQPYPGQPYPGQPYGYGYPPQVKRPWIVAPPAGARYHRMARTEVHRWWRPVVGTLLIIVGAIAAMLGLMIIGAAVSVMVNGGVWEPTDDGFFGNDTADLAFQLAALAILLPLVPLAAWAVQRRRPGTVSSVAGRLRWKWLLACCGVAIGFCVVSVLASWAASLVVEPPETATTTPDTFVGWDDFLLPALVIVLLVPFQASAEEYVFRGWLLQAIGACTLETRTGAVGRAFSKIFRTPWPGIVIGSALFMSGHGYTGWGMLDVFLFGAIAGWLAVRSGGLEASIAVHVFNNLMAFLLPAAVGKLDIEQGAVPWQYVIADVAPLVLYALVIVWLVRRFKIQTVSGEPAAARDDAASGGTPDAAVVPGNEAPPAVSPAAGH